MKIERYSLGASYWGNILLFKELIDLVRRDSYLESIKNYYDDRFDKINFISEQIV
ncbi:unnamed protein product, partial [marine sediment metagenome]